MRWRGELEREEERQIGGERRETRSWRRDGEKVNGGEIERGRRRESRGRGIEEKEKEKKEGGKICSLEGGREEQRKV